MPRYRFKCWENPDLTDPTRVIDLKTDINLTAYYEEESIMGTVTFAGMVTAQAAVGEAVAITVTKPDGETEVVNTQTREDLSFVDLDYENLPGNYKANARIGEDAFYQPAESGEVPFTIGKELRTITLTIAPK